MRKLFLAAGLAAAALVPSLATAQQSCAQQRDNQVVGTVAGAGLGALIGSAIAPRGDRTTGAIIGGVGGAVVGNQVAKPYADCTHAYGYYDRNSQWHANAIARADARGYYDRNGAWVDGAPNGYYDTRGVWIVTPSAGAYGANASYDVGVGRRDVRSREAWLDQRIRSAARDGSLNRRDARNGLDRLNSIRRQDSGMRDGQGRLAPQDERRLQARLDQLSATLGLSVNSARY